LGPLRVAKVCLVAKMASPDGHIKNKCASPENGRNNPIEVPGQSVRFQVGADPSVAAPH
jgi:hypothetical protein